MQEGILIDCFNSCGFFSSSCSHQTSAEMSWSITFSNGFAGLRVQARKTFEGLLNDVILRPALTTNILEANAIPTRNLFVRQPY